MWEPLRRTAASSVKSSSGAVDAVENCRIVVYSDLTFSRAKQIFKENEDQVEAMVEQLGYKIVDDFLHHI